MKIKQYNSGFTLIEVLIVLILLSGGFMILLQALNTGKFMNTKAEVLTQQAVLLNNTIQEIRSRRFDENTTAPWSTSLGLDNSTNAHLSFDGANDYLTIDNPTGIPSGNDTYTMAAWIKPSSMGSRGIIGWGGFGSSNRSNALRLMGGNQIRHYWWGNDLDVVCGDLTDTWHYIVALYDGTTRKVYLDGNLLGSDTPNGHNAIVGNFRIGSTNNGEYFHGLINEVSVWNIGLTQSQIQTIMNNGLIGNEEGLVGYWNFNEGSGSTLTDLSGNNNGTINGATWGSSQSSSESTISGWDDIDDFNLYSVSEIPNYTAFGRSVKVDYVQSSNGFHSAISGPSDYKRVMVEINHKTIPALRDTFIVSPGL